MNPENNKVTENSRTILANSKTLYLDDNNKFIVIEVVNVFYYLYCYFIKCTTTLCLGIIIITAALGGENFFKVESIAFNATQACDLLVIANIKKSTFPYFSHITASQKDFLVFWLPHKDFIHHKIKVLKIHINKRSSIKN